MPIKSDGYSGAPQTLNRERTMTLEVLADIGTTATPHITPSLGDCQAEIAAVTLIVDPSLVRIYAQSGSRLVKEVRMQSAIFGAAPFREIVLTGIRDWRSL
jgi:hypothetical protein